MGSGVRGCGGERADPVGGDDRPPGHRGRGDVEERSFGERVDGCLVDPVGQAEAAQGEPASSDDHERRPGRSLEDLDGCAFGQGVERGVVDRAAFAVELLERGREQHHGEPATGGPLHQVERPVGAGDDAGVGGASGRRRVDEVGQPFGGDPGAALGGMQRRARRRGGRPIGGGRARGTGGLERVELHPEVVVDGGHRPQLAPESRPLVVVVHVVVPCRSGVGSAARCSASRPRP